MTESGNGEFDLDWAAFLRDGTDDLNLDFLDQPVDVGVTCAPDLGFAFSIGDLERFLMTDEEESDHNALVDEFLRFDSGSGTPTDASTTPETVASEETPTAEKKDDSVDDLDDNDDAAKRKKRKMRNRDAAVKSRERKKEYVKELEMKSKYYEAECKRLGILLQYYVAENQALRFSMNHQKAFDGSMSKQESAVLLLESLLLGSLLGYMGIIIWLLLLLPLHPPALRTGRRTEPSIADEGRKKPRSKVLTVTFPSFMLSKKCRGTRSRMKPGFISICSTCLVA